MKRVTASMEKIRVWAGHNETNMSAKLQLCEAELARVTGDPLVAQTAFEKAIAAAKRFGFKNEEAIANELAGRFYLSHGNRTVGRAYIDEASHAYDRWGALAKVAQLEQEFSDLLVTRRGVAAHTATATTTATHNLDLQTVIKASQALSSEIRLGSLLGRMIEMAVENAGATRGALIMEQGGVSVVQAETEAEGETRSQHGTPVGERHDLAQSVIAYVARTGDWVVLEDGRHDTRFDKDPHLKRDHAISVLCSPVVYQGKRSGILYLENTLIAGAFTPDRIQLLEMLSSQAAISIENARLYEETRTMAQSFERFVPKDFIKPLGLDSVVDVALGDAVKRETSVLFSDIRGFTSLFERLEVGEGVSLLNRYLSRMSPLITDHGGFIDKFIGDAIMALFSDGPDGALSAAIAMHRELRAAQGDLGHTLQAGIGIHHGPLMICTVGSERRLEMTAIGDTVNTAARLEAATKALGCGLVVSDQVVASLKNRHGFGLRRVGAAKVYGRETPLGLYEAFDGDPPALVDGKRQTLDLFASGVEAMQGKHYPEAAQLFEACVERTSDDQVARTLATKCRLLASGNAGHVAKGDLDFV